MIGFKNLFKFKIYKKKKKLYIKICNQEVVKKFIPLIRYDK